MCTDKALEELTTYEDLVAEAEKMGQEWQIVLIACLSGSNGNSPEPSAAESGLKRMVEAVQLSGDLSKYLAFDRSGTPIQFG